MLSVVLYAAAAIALGTPPDATADGQAVADWFASQGEHVRTWAWLLTLYAPVYAAAATLVPDRLPAPYRDVYFFGAIAFVVETAIQSWVWAGVGCLRAHRIHRPGRSEPGRVMTAATWLLMAVGSIPGFFVGRWTAEFGRARYDQKRVWAQRQNYRRND